MLLFKEGRYCTAPAYKQFVGKIPTRKDVLLFSFSSFWQMDKRCVELLLNMQCFERAESGEQSVKYFFL